MEALRPELTAVPVRLLHLPVHRGYPVPWFVAWVNGAPDFRVADTSKWDEAVRDKKCWVCGQKLGRFLAFVLGPMCGITRSTAEPPCHKECAVWSAMNCPFLVRPQMVRRENDLPEETTSKGCPIARNPGATLVWVSVNYRVFPDHNNGLLIEVGEPLTVEAYKQGRLATVEEVMESVSSGLPLLEEMTEKEPTPARRAEAKKALAEHVDRFTRLLELNLNKERIAV